MQNAIPFLEEMCPEVASDKWLMGTDDLTLIDIMCGAPWDFFYTHYLSPAMCDSAGILDLVNKAPKFMAYMERFRAHSKIAPVCMNQQVVNRHAERARGWE